MEIQKELSNNDDQEEKRIISKNKKESLETDEDSSDDNEEDDIIGSNDEYVILAETNYEYNETWYYFLRREDNEDELEQLASDLNQFDFEEDNIDFDKIGGFLKIDLENDVPGFVAKWMTTSEINTYYHRKFDGKLQNIDFKFKKGGKSGSKRDSKQKRAQKIWDVLGGRKIDKFINQEDELEFEEDEDSDDTDNDSAECDDTSLNSEDGISDLGTSF